jgi:hypothetical protein
VIEESPALLVRERSILATFVDSLAELLRSETGAAADDITPWVAANAMIGLHRALISYTRRQILAGTRNPELWRLVQGQARAALGALAPGLESYAVRSR